MRGVAYVLGMISMLLAFLTLLFGTMAAFAEANGLTFVIALGAAIGCCLWGGIVLMLVSIDERLEDSARWAARERAAIKAREEGGGV